MTTLEKTVDIIRTLPEPQLDVVFHFVTSLQQRAARRARISAPLFPLRDGDTRADALARITGIFKGESKTLDEYRDERLSERYGLDDRH